MSIFLIHVTTDIVYSLRFIKIYLSDGDGK